MTTARHFKDYAKQVVLPRTHRYTAHSQHKSLHSCPSVSQSRHPGIEKLQGVEAKIFNYMTWPLQVLSPTHVVSETRTDIASAQFLVLCEQNSTNPDAGYPDRLRPSAKFVQNSTKTNFPMKLPVIGSSTV